MSNVNIENSQKLIENVTSLNTRIDESNKKRERLIGNETILTQQLEAKVKEFNQKYGMVIQVDQIDSLLESERAKLQAEYEDKLKLVESIEKGTFTEKVIPIPTLQNVVDVPEDVNDSETVFENIGKDNHTEDSEEQTPIPVVSIPQVTANIEKEEAISISVTPNAKPNVVISNNPPINTTISLDMEEDSDDIIVVNESSFDEIRRLVEKK